MTAKFSDLIGTALPTPVTAKCETHGEFQQFSTRLAGRELKTKCPACTKALDAERSRQAAVEFDAERRAAKANSAAARSAEILAAAQLPKRFLGKTFSTFAAETVEQRAALTVCRGYAENFDEHRDRGDGLLLSGSVGCGKTHLAAAIMQAVMPRRRAMYSTVPELIRAVRDTWRKESKFSTTQVIESMRSMDLLVIDEVGVQTGTDGEQVILYDILDGRYRDCMPTVMVTNLDGKAMRQAIGDRLYDRLRETSRRVLFDWDSHRPKARES